MDTRNIQYSLKNIPIPSQFSYLKCLVQKTEDFVRRLRWKVFWYEKKLQGGNTQHTDPTNSAGEEYYDHEPHNNYGFKSSKTPPKNPYIKNFETDLFAMINEIRFKNKPNHFQRTLKNDVNDTKSSTKLTISADKTPNLYLMETEEYRRLLHNNITTSYHKPQINNKINIDRQAKQIANKLKSKPCRQN